MKRKRRQLTKEQKETLKLLEVAEQGALDVLNDVQKLINYIRLGPPKRDYYDVVLEQKEPVSINRIAKDYGMNKHQMFELLCSLNFYKKNSMGYTITKESAERGYTKSTFVPFDHPQLGPIEKLNSKWTQAGRFEIYHKLKKIGYLPLIEQKSKNNSK